MQHKLGDLKSFINSSTQSKTGIRHAMVGPADLWKMKRDFQFQFLKTMSLEPEHYLLDIGCGTLRGGIPLINYLEERHYFGIEVREKALNEGRKELREAGLEKMNPTLLLFSDISQLTIEQKFNFIWAFSVLFHMSDEILNNTLDFVNRHLSDDGVFYANVNIGEHEESTWHEFPFVARPFEFYRDACTKYGLAVSDLGALKDHGHVSNVELQDNQRMFRITKKTNNG